MESYKVIRQQATESKLYKLGEVIQLDQIAARVLLAYGVIEPHKQTPGPSETKPDAPEQKKQLGDGWLESARQALKSGDQKAIGSALLEVDGAKLSNVKGENARQLQLEVDARAGQ